MEIGLCHSLLCSIKKIKVKTEPCRYVSDTVKYSKVKDTKIYIIDLPSQLLLEFFTSGTDLLSLLILFFFLLFLLGATSSKKPKAGSAF